ncbi:MAG: methyl-accepting chemotaxis protein [Treponemataceae bacterium]|nr:methyl-accepting chemotaxis protein [Treponemataceae bacterium]
MKRLFSVLLILTLTAVAVFAGSNVPLNTSWKYAPGDEIRWKAPTFNDSSWAETTVPGTIQTAKNSYLWLRATVSVPANLTKEPLYLNVGHAYAAYDIYADGIYLGSYGIPEKNVRSLRSLAVLVPENLVTDGTLTIALRVWTPVDVCKFTEPLSLVDASQARVINFWRNLIGCEMYVIIAALCIFIGLYSLIQYLLDHTNTHLLAFTMSSFTIAVYFWDMGGNTMLFPFLLQRLVARWMLPVSLGYLWIFMSIFMKGHVKKSTIIAKYAVSAFFGIAYLMASKVFNLTETLFTVSLAFIMFVIVYGVATSIKIFATRKTEASVILGGFMLGICFAVYDVICQVAGKVPFAWLQGYAFFTLDLSVFASIALKSAVMQKEISSLAVQASAQNKKLETMFEHARQLSSDVMAIAGELNESVENVHDASTISVEESKGIEKAVDQQESSLAHAAESFAKLIHAIQTNSSDLEQGTASIANAAEGTANLIRGFESVGEGISGAAGFARTLDGLTAENQAGIEKLSRSMEEMREKSTEILKVVQVLDDFSERTNLLAMNASIEAAHAGSAGAGFAVVANEIKSLAAQSSAQAAKIGDNIRQITDVIEQSVSMCSSVKTSLEQIRSEAGATAGHVQAAADEMQRQQAEGKHIEAEAAALAQMAVRMRDSASEQNTYGNQVKASMDELTAAAHRVDEATRSITMAAKALSEYVENLKATSTKTADAARELENLYTN